MKTRNSFFLRKRLTVFDILKGPVVGSNTTINFAASASLGVCHSLPLFVVVHHSDYDTTIYTSMTLELVVLVSAIGIHGGHTLGRYKLGPACIIVGKKVSNKNDDHSHSEDYSPSSAVVVHYGQYDITYHNIPVYDTRVGSTLVRSAFIHGGVFQYFCSRIFGPDYFVPSS